MTYEKTSVRVQKNWVLEKLGKSIIIDVNTITSIDTKDDTFYIDTGLKALALKFIYHLN